MASSLPTRSGVKYVSNLKNFARRPLTVDDFRKFSKTLYGKSLYIKLSTMVFTKPPTLTVYTPSNDVDEITQTALNRIFFSEKVNLLTVGHFRFFDKFFYGPTILNQEWAKVGPVSLPIDLVRLPPYSFHKLPTGRDKYSDVIPGITLNPDGGTIECWQSVGTKPTTLLDPSSIYIIQSAVVDGLVESPIIEPIIPFIDMLLYGWETGMQVMKRGAAPILFIKITLPKPASDQNGWVSDEEYANIILENWDKDTAFTLRDNMEIIDFKYDNTISLEIIDALYSVILDSLNPASFMSKDGTQLGGSQTGQLELMSAFIGGMQTEIEAALTHIANQYFAFNFYPVGYRSEVKIPRMDTRNRQLDIEEAKEGATNLTLSYNECRKRLQAEEVDEEARIQILNEWEQVKKVSTPPVSSQPFDFAMNLGKKDLPDKVRRIPTEEQLSSNLETDLWKMIDEATQEIVAAVAG